MGSQQIGQDVDQKVTTDGAFALKVAPRSVALLVIDMQRDYLDDDGILVRMGDSPDEGRALVPRLHSFLSGARTIVPTIIFTRHERRPEVSSPAGREHYERLGLARPLDPRMEEWYGVEPVGGDLILPKHRYSAFVGTSLEMILRSRGVQTVILTGIATNVCVESTARDAFMRDFSVVIAEDLTAGTSPEAKRSSLQNLARFFGEVVSSDRILAAWGIPRESVSA